MGLNITTKLQAFLIPSILNNVFILNPQKINLYISVQKF